MVGERGGGKNGLRRRLETVVVALVVDEVGERQRRQVVLTGGDVGVHQSPAGVLVSWVQFEQPSGQMDDRQMVRGRAMEIEQCGGRFSMQDAVVLPHGVGPLVVGVVGQQLARVQQIGFSEVAEGQLVVAGTAKSPALLDVPGQFVDVSPDLAAAQAVVVVGEDQFGFGPLAAE